MIRKILSALRGSTQTCPPAVDGREQRQFPRYDCRHFVSIIVRDISGSPTEVPAQIINISVSGCLMKPTVEFPPQEPGGRGRINSFLGVPLLFEIVAVTSKGLHCSFDRHVPDHIFEEFLHKQQR